MSTVASQLQGPASYIYEGIWTNWSKGRISGSTLTLSAHNAWLLSPALAILISIAGGQLWRLFQFALHQSRATSERKNYLFHQQQVALRNTAVDINTLWRCVQFAFAWRHEKEVHSFWQSAPLVLFILLHVCLVNLAGLFSSSLLNAGDQVLSRAPNCGTYNNTYLQTVFGSDDSEEAQSQRIEFHNHMNSIYASVQQHVDICSTSVEGCDTLPVKSLNWTKTLLPGKCPFESSVCHPDSQGTVLLDSNYISSHSNLGFNFPNRDQMAFRMNTQCAPLNDLRFVSDWNDTAPRTMKAAQQISDAMYGPSWTSQRNATYSVIKQDLTCEQQMTIPPYSLKVVNAQANGTWEAGTADFDPIPELRLTDAELDLVLLSFGGAYNGPVSDPWFSSQTTANVSNAYCEKEELYTRDLPLTAMGCKSQWQICRPDLQDHFNNASCTPPLGRLQLEGAVYADNFVQGLTNRQRATIDRILYTINFGSINQVIDKLSQATVAPLLARHNMSSTIGSALPADQWQKEVDYWFSILLSYYQVTSLQLGTGQFAASSEYVNITRPSKTDPEQMAAYEICQNQIIRSSVYQNFNFFALMLTVILCVIIIILGLTIEDVIGCIRKRQEKSTGHNQDMWDLNSDIEMLKTISIRNTNTPWSRSANGVPLASAGSTACIAELGCETWTTEEAIGVVHHRTTKGLAQYRSRGNRIYGSDDERNGAVSSETRSSFDFVNQIRGSSEERAEFDESHGHTYHQYSVPQSKSFTQFDSYSERPNAAAETYLRAQRRPPSGWGVLPSRFSGFWSRNGTQDSAW